MLSVYLSQAGRTQRLWPEHKAHLGVRQSEKRGWMDGWMHEKKYQRKKGQHPNSEPLPLGPAWMFLHSTWGGCQCTVRLLSLVPASFRSPLHNWLLIRSLWKLMLRTVMSQNDTITVFCFAVNICKMISHNSTTHGELSHLHHFIFTHDQYFGLVTVWN